MSLDECETLADVTAFDRRERAEQERLSRLKVNRPRCGARTRAGGECAAPVVWDAKAGKPVNGRCRMHGGLSTGPRSAEGRARALANLMRGKEHNAGRNPNANDGHN